MKNVCGDLTGDNEELAVDGELVDDSRGPPFLLKVEILVYCYILVETSYGCGRENSGVGCKKINGEGLPMVKSNTFSAPTMAARCAPKAASSRMVQPLAPIS